MKYKLHYVGKRLYSLKLFIREAEQHGVSRAIPLSIVGKMKWGEPILLAFYDTKKGVANIFGYFTVDTITHNFPKLLADELCRKVHIVDSKKVDVEVDRGCGSYIVRSIAYTDEELEKVVEKIKEVAEKYNYKVKIFVGGKLKIFKEMIRVPAKFTRSIVYVDLDVDIKTLPQREVRIVRIDNYRRRSYWKRGEKERFLSEGGLERWVR